MPPCPDSLFDPYPESISGKAVSVYRSLLRTLQRNEWRIESRINPAFVSDWLGVSVTPAREALQRLASNRIIGFSPRRGYFVLPFEVQRLDNCYETCMSMLWYLAIRYPQKTPDTLLLGDHPPLPEKDADEATRHRYGEQMAFWLAGKALEAARISGNVEIERVLRVCYARNHVITAIDNEDVEQSMLGRSMLIQVATQLREQKGVETLTALDAYFRRRAERLPTLIELANERARQAPLPSS